MEDAWLSSSIFISMVVGLIAKVGINFHSYILEGN